MKTIEEADALAADVPDVVTDDDGDPVVDGAALLDRPVVLDCAAVLESPPMLVCAPVLVNAPVLDGPPVLENAPVLEDPKELLELVGMIGTTSAGIT